MLRRMRPTSTIPMPSASSAGADAPMPFVWSNRFEGAYDSPTGRWLAFGALNRLCVTEMRQLRHGRLGSAEGYSQGIQLRESLWPNWMADQFGADIVRFCRKCANIGYHSVFHQIPSLSHCPWHNCALTSACLHCGESGAIRGSLGYLQPVCRACRKHPFPDGAARYLRTPTFFAGEEHAFGALGRALNFCKRIRIRFMTGYEERYPLTIRPSSAEVLRALVETERAPPEVAETLFAASAKFQEAVTIPIRGNFDKCGWRSAWRRFRDETPVYDGVDLTWINEASFHIAAPELCRALLKDVVDGSGMVLRPPATRRYWMLVLRSWLNDYFNNPPCGPRAVRPSLRHRMLIKLPAHEPEWLVLRVFGDV